MDNKTKIKAVEAWQKNKRIHPLTCGNDSRHKKLVAIEHDGRVTLRCPDCKYVQDWVPEVVYENKYNEGK